MAIPFPLLGPIVVLILFRKDSYVAMHAWQEILGEMALKIVLVLVVLASLAQTIYTVIQNNNDHWQHFSIWPLLLKSVAIWVALAVFGVLNTIGSLIAAIRAYQGNVGGKGLISRMARRLSGALALGVGR